MSPRFALSVCSIDAGSGCDQAAAGDTTTVNAMDSARAASVRCTAAEQSKYIAKLGSLPARLCDVTGRWLTACYFLHAVAPARIPLSTYRLQFHREFTFRDARAIVDYLHDLGVSDCYASSYLKAVPGSPHGYDVADPTRLNPDVGTDAEYTEWVDALASRGMGQVMDVVPNHMGIAKSANPWWLDVLENGAASRFAHFFDIEWHPVKDELADKVLIPILGDQYGEVLERQELTLVYADGAFHIKYYEEVLPVAP